MTPEALADRHGLSQDALEGLKTYAATLLKWQARINLIGPATVGDVWERHIADGLQLIDHLRPSDKIICDLGSGGGIPGLVIAIARPDLTVHLVESNGKKAAFLREAARLAGATHVRVHPVRIEAIDSEAIRADVVTARALAPLPKLLELARPLLENGARALFLKGQDVAGELTETAKSWILEPELLPSRTDPRGVIVKLDQVRQRP